MSLSGLHFIPSAGGALTTEGENVLLDINVGLVPTFYFLVAK